MLGLGCRRGVGSCRLLVRTSATTRLPARRFLSTAGEDELQQQKLRGTAEIDDILSDVLDGSKEEDRYITLENRTRALIREHDFEQVEKKLNMLVEDFPQHVSDLLVLRGESLAAQGAWEEAFANLQQSTVVAPSNKRAMLQRARFCQEHGLILHAINDYSMLCPALNPNEEALSARCMLYLQAAAFAEKDPAKAGYGNPDDLFNHAFEDLTALGRLLEDHVRRTKTQAGISKALRKNKLKDLVDRKLRLALYKAKCLDRSGIYKRAKKEYKQILNEATGHLDAESVAEVERRITVLEAAMKEQETRKEEKKNRGKKKKKKAAEEEDEEDKEADLAEGREDQKHPPVVVYVPTRHELETWKRGLKLQERLADNARKTMVTADGETEVTKSEERASVERFLKVLAADRRKKELGV